MATAAKLETRNFTKFAPTEVAETYIAKARELRDLLRAEAAEGERRRSPTPAVDQALKENGLLTLLLPQRWGGAGLSFSDYSRFQMELAKGDTSVSWVAQIVNGTTWVASLTSDATQATLFGEGPKYVCGAYNPPGKAKRVDGGWIVNGAWPYTSGSRQSDWAQSGVVLEGYEGPVVPGINMVYIPFSQLEIQDSWYVTGMQGTGSDTSVAKDVFVPDHLMVMMDKPFGHVEPNKQHYGAPSDRVPVVPVVRATGLAQLVGGAEAMLEIVEAESTKKPIVTTTYQKRTDSGVVLHDLGRVAAQLGTARLLLLDATGTLDDVGLTGREFSFAERAKHKAQCSQIVELVHSSIEALMFISGSSAFALDKPISRFWRDIHVGLRHVQNIPMLGYEIFGRTRLGVDNITPPGAY
ncbi:acyl-CoA dehydrogenase [Sphingomonas sp. DBB INV C78]|uniref:acyl-CoA dehydrogenase family protein n=1 Tax=unclassified Sphingomonas TaxID=196159 RepID=UPI000248B59C|nr:acyl-CoA dehydrogenase family protein [Sphingomonas sp. KC8]ARS26938.1 acyl-CoA dehydrogenase [Sphingomonas sp. KC8]